MRNCSRTCYNDRMNGSDYQYSKPHNSREKGSALFIILIAVMLFIALSLAVAEIMRSGDPNAISEQKAQLYADEILSYTRSLRQAAQTLRISGCDTLDVSFSNSTVTGYDHSPVVPDSCKIFHPDGGDLVYMVPPQDWLDGISPAPTSMGEWYFPDDVCVDDIGTSGSGSGCNSDSIDNEDIIAVLPYIKKPICIELNELLGITSGGADPPQEAGNAWRAGNTKFVGAQIDGIALTQTGRMNGCFEGSDPNLPAAETYHFFQVLVPR